jgi:threonine aldolase
MTTPAAITPTTPGFHTQFASDNTAGIAPEALAAFNAANVGFLPSYGEDATTRAVCDRLREVFETDCDVYFVFNGTAANSLALASMCQSYHGVVCAETGHVETDECGAPEFFSNGAKLLTVPQTQGKIAPDDVARLITKRSDLHFPRAKVLTISQSTEVGTVYAIDEVRALTELARAHGLRTHMDGARFANAVAALSQTGCAPADITWRAGIDVLCFGGTKMGLPVGEAIVFFDRALGEEFNWRCKQAGQLASKMRYLSAPWLAMLKGDTWLRHASHANAMATLLAAQLNAIPGISAPTPHANAVFAQLPTPVMLGLRARGWYFYDFIGGSARFMCSWATTTEAVAALVADVTEVSK